LQNLRPFHRDRLVADVRAMALAKRRKDRHVPRRVLEQAQWFDSMSRGSRRRDVGDTARFHTVLERRILRSCFVVRAWHTV